jgi:hypothetical protein
VLAGIMVDFRGIPFIDRQGGCFFVRFGIYGVTVGYEMYIVHYTIPVLVSTYIYGV